MRKGVKQPCYDLDSGSEATIVIKTETQEPTPALIIPQTPVPIVPEQLQLLGELKAKVESLEALTQEQKQQIELLMSEERWTSDRISSLWTELYRVQEQVQEQEEPEAVQTELSQIPVIPEQSQVEQQAQPEKPKSFWSLSNWI